MELQTRLIVLFSLSLHGIYGGNNARFEVFKDAKTWQGAMRSCEILGGEIALIKNELTQHNAIGTIVDSSENTDDDYWIGATDSYREGTWRAKEGKPLWFTNWGPHQPGLDRSENCAVLRGSMSFKWAADNCDDVHSYLCQFDNSEDRSDDDADDAAGENDYCEDGWISLHNSCLYVGNEPLAWDEAKEQCELRQSELVMMNQISDSDVAALLYNIIESESDSNSPEMFLAFWVGMQESSNRQREITPYEKKIGQSSYCTEVVLGDNDVDLSNEKCGALRPFICERNKNTATKILQAIACEDDRVVIDCGPLDIHVVDAVFGRNRNDICETPLRRAIRDGVNCSAISSLGVVRSRCEGRRSCRVYASVRDFGNPCHGVYKYLAVDYYFVCDFSNDIILEDLRLCDVYMVCIGQYEFNSPCRALSQSFPVTPHLPPLRIVDHYVSYKVYTNAQVGWQGAIKSCSNEGATLAMISDSYTQRKIVEKLVEMGGITGKYWFDGKVSMDSDIWKSKSGSPLTHFNWADRQPITGPNKCAVLSNNGEYMWEAENCGERNGYICTFHANNKITVPCDDNWIQYGNACYSLRMDGRNWTSARDECAEAGAELVKINTNTATRLLSVVEKKIGLIMDRFWIGLHEAIRLNKRVVLMDDGTCTSVNMTGTHEPIEKDILSLVMGKPGLSLHITAYDTVGECTNHQQSLACQLLYISGRVAHIGCMGLEYEDNVQHHQCACGETH
ncbi:C-type mannose receptor 2-like [Saccoglossus kowalevskii]